MGRSVGTPSYETVWTEYFALNDEIDDQDAFDWFFDDLQGALCFLFKSVDREDAWLDREGHIIAGNRLGVFVLYEYCGLCSLSFVPSHTIDPPRLYGYSDPDTTSLAFTWGEQVHDKVKGILPDRLAKIATASNGEAFFKRIGA